MPRASMTPDVRGSSQDSRLEGYGHGNSAPSFLYLITVQVLFEFSLTA
jgi:hypothetical protein